MSYIFSLLGKGTISKSIVAAFIINIISAICIPCASAQNHSIEAFKLNWEVSALASLSQGTFAPYYIASNRYGVITQGDNVLLSLGLYHLWDKQKRFSYGFGAEVWGGISSRTNYLRFSDNKLQNNKQHPTPFWIQQFYGELKYRSVFLTVGAKNHRSDIVDYNLSSGDIVLSGNARPIPQVRVGFIDYQNVPFTKGWLQIAGEISYGKYTDNNWLKKHYNYYQQHITLGQLSTYKSCHFRTNPEKPFYAVLGMQIAGAFGGDVQWYYYGKQSRSRKLSKGIKQFFKMLLPTDGGVEYYSGSSLGSWDIVLNYGFKSGATIKAYMQKPFEDGSGIGFLNGFDGLWGLEFKLNKKSWINGAVIEILDFTNQSGPSHWDPDDNPGTDIRFRAEGADDYYNNHEYNSYANYGMAIGTPFVISPIYNTDGCMMFLYNRMRGFHIAIEGNPIQGLEYRVMGGYRKSWGNGYMPLIETKSMTSFMAEATYSIPHVKGLSVNCQIAMDKGNLISNNVGGCLKITYSGNVQIMR